MSKSGPEQLSRWNPIGIYGECFTGQQALGFRPDRMWSSFSVIEWLRNIAGHVHVPSSS